MVETTIDEELTTAIQIELQPHCEITGEVFKDAITPIQKTKIQSERFKTRWDNHYSENPIYLFQINDIQSM